MPLASEPLSAAREQVIALVSGVPSPKRERWRLAIFQAFVDDSRQGNDALILAGYVSTVDRWAAFSTEWAELLTLKPEVEAFKMSRFAASGEKAMWERAEWHYRLIEKYCMASVAIAIDIPQMRRISAEYNFEPSAMNPYHLGWLFMLNMVAQHSEETGFTGPVDFIFDEQAEKRFITDGWDAYLASLPEVQQAWTGHQPLFRDDKEFMPLQAADLLAWWTRLRFIERGSIVNDVDPLFPHPKYPFSWSEKPHPVRRMGYFVAELREEDYRRFFARQLQQRQPQSISRQTFGPVWGRLY